MNKCSIVTDSEPNHPIIRNVCMYLHLNCIKLAHLLSDQIKADEEESEALEEEEVEVESMS